nr:structural maintenance of chromosomes protein 4 [Tanacetum cinerariifolium]
MGNTRTNDLRNEIKKSKKEKDRVIARDEILVSTLREINQRILKVDEYKTTQQLIHQHKGVLVKAKSDSETLKKTVNELQAFDVLLEAQMLERVALLEAQMEKMNLNLNSISDYRENYPNTMREWRS